MQTTTCNPTQTRFETTTGIPFGNYEFGKFAMMNREMPWMCPPTTNNCWQPTNNFCNNWPMPWNQTWQPNWYCPQPTYYNQQYNQPCPPWMTNNCTQPQPYWCQPEQQYNTTLCNIGCRPTNNQELYCLTNPIRVLNREGDRCLYLCFDMRCFRPEEINCTFNRTERCITIECGHECKEGKEHYIQRKYCRKYCFPECLSKCDLTKCECRCYQNTEGQLCIECTLPRMTTEEMNRCPPTCPTQFGCYTPVTSKVC